MKLPRSNLKLRQSLKKLPLQLITTCWQWKSLTGSLVVTNCGPCSMKNHLRVSMEVESIAIGPCQLISVKICSSPRPNRKKTISSCWFWFQSCRDWRSIPGYFELRLHPRRMNIVWEPMKLPLPSFPPFWGSNWTKFWIRSRRVVPCVSKLSPAIKPSI